MKAVHKHAVTVNGVTLTRSSQSRMYSHVIVGVHRATGKPTALQWCGTPALAARAVRTRKSQSWTVREYSSITAVANGDDINLDKGA